MSKRRNPVNVAAEGRVLRTSQIVGRESERAVLEELVRTVRRGGRMAVVEGEAGIGKTRLVQAAMAAARDGGVTVLASKAEELESHRPFGAIVDLAGRERLERHLGASDLRPDAGDERQFRISESVLELLDELCARAPVLIAIEDLHWADAGTLGVLARVAVALERLPAALLVSARPQPRRPELERLLGVLAGCGATELRLGPLDDGECAELLAGLVGARPGARLVEQARRAAGNPLFVSELVAALEADGAVVRSDGTAEIAVDEGLPSLPLTILHRLSFLPTDVLDLLGLASVLGASFVASDLALLARRPVSELVPALRAALLAGVVAEQGERLAFRHELVRDALYEDMPLTVRRGLHAELAALLAAAGEPIERISEHLLRSAAPGDERAVAALADAARELAGRAPGGAVDLYRQAIALSADPASRRAELLPELAEALVSAGLLGEGEDACREALASGADPAWAARLRLHLVLLLTRRGRTADAAREAEAGLATPEIRGSDRDRLRAWLALSRVFEGEVEPAVDEARAVLETSSDDLARALATNTLAIAADAGGAFAEAAGLIAPNVGWADRTGAREAHDSRPHMILGLMQIRLDRFDDALGTIERGRRASEALGIADAVPVFHYQRALLDFSRGQLDDALAELATRDRLSAQTEIGWHVPAESLRSLIALHHDDLLAAERHVATAERDLASGAPPFGIDLMLLARALVLEAAGDASPALDALASTFAAAPTFQPVIGPDLARLAGAAGRPGLAAGVAPALRAIADRNPGAASLEAAALRAEGRPGPAYALLRDAGRELEAARAAEEAGGQDLLGRARDAYERCGATRDLARVEAALRGAGVRRGVSGRRARPASGWDALTDTELKVVRLVAERLTNPEIAERMFISPRTVQTHVSHALAKVGVAGRRELAAEAGRRAGWQLRVEGIGQQPEQPEPAVEAPVRRPVDGDGA